MSQDATEIDLDALQRRMDGAMTALRAEFASLRTGRASASILEPIQVDAYGQMTPINQLGTINVPEPRMVVINVWDKGMISKVERAIRDSGIGINPVVDGPLIRLPIPELNEERRREQGCGPIRRTGQGRHPQCAPRRHGPDQEGESRRPVGRRPEDVCRRGAGADG